MKKITLLFLSVICSLTMFAQSTLYLNTGGSDLWGGESMQYALCYTDVNNVSQEEYMTLVIGETYIYAVVTPAVTGEITFKRYTSAGTSDQSSYLTIPTDGNDMYIVTSYTSEWFGSATTGEWDKYEPSTGGSTDTDDGDGTGDDVVSGTTFYLNTGGSDLWGIDDVSYAFVYNTGTSTTVVFTAMTPVDGVENLYSATVSCELEEIKYVYFTINPSGEANPSMSTMTVWTDADYNIGGNLYTITGVQVGGDVIRATTGIWSTYGESTGGDGPTVDVDVNVVNAFDVIGNNGRLYINGEGDAQLMVYSITGQVVVNTSFNSNFNCQLQKGIYIIQLNGVAQKVSLY